MKPILEVKNLTHTYDETTPFSFDAVDDVSFSVYEGEIIGIIGHTGSGKSTLVSHLNGLLKPTSGKIYFDGVDIWEKPKEIKNIRSKIGLVFQYPEYQLFEETVFKDIAFGPKNMVIAGDELKTRVFETCKLLQIDESFLDKSPFDLSGGEKRRVAIAGIMAMRPKIIIFDEPIAGLDPMGRKNIIKMIEDYRKAYNATVIIISHNMEDMAVLADKLLVMNSGHMVMFDKTENVFKNSDLLKKIGLNVPIVTQIFEKLSGMGMKISTDVFTVEDGISLILKYQKEGDKNA